MSQENLDISILKNDLIKYARDRDWEKFHSPKNLAMALSVEASELVEIFQWLSEEDSLNVSKSEDKLRAVSDEVADIMLYLIRICTVLDINIPDAIDKKIQKNIEKYPAAICYGSSKKYTEYTK